MSEPLPPKKHKPNSLESNPAGTVKRGWQSWSTEEKEVFFRNIKEFGRDFDTITSKIGSKSYEQVRHFYYRVIKKINKILKPSKIDNKDQKEVITALLCFWEVKRGVTEKEDYTKEFANSLRELIAKRMVELQKDESILGAAAMGKKAKKSGARKSRGSKSSSSSGPSASAVLAEMKKEPLLIDSNSSNPDNPIDPPLALAYANEHIHRLPQNAKQFGVSSLPTVLPSLSSITNYGNPLINPLTALTQLSANPLPPRSFFSSSAFAPPMNMISVSPSKTASNILLNRGDSLGENSLPLIEDTSCDSYVANNDMDEIACKNFYNQFEVSLLPACEALISDFWFL